MPGGSSHLLISLIILVLCSGFFSATETAYSCLSKIKLKTLFTNGNKRAGKVLEFAETKYDRLLSTILIGNNIVNISASAIATIFFARLLVNTKIDSTFVATVVMTIALLIFGEITPKYIAKAYPEKLSMLFYPVIKAIYYLLIPVNVIFIGWKKLISKIFRLDRKEVITEDEIMTFVEEAEDAGTLNKNETKLIQSVIDFDDLEAKTILTPRVNITAVKDDTDLESVKKLFQKSGFSRLPLFSDSLDNITGVIHLKDFYRKSAQCKSIKDIAQKPYFITEHTKISKLLKDFQKKQIQFSVVLDEYGGTLGIVTMEDILEELVGEIWDEHDTVFSDYHKCPDGSFIFSGTISLEKMFDLIGADIEKVERKTSTLSGWIIEQKGEIPAEGSLIESDDFTLEILKTNDKIISKIKVYVKEKEKL
ncbi:MAG: hemolysin family protein [Treponema sp.]|nr:hemolysin family protein [Treponema sp.]